MFLPARLSPGLPHSRTLPTSATAALLRIAPAPFSPRFCREFPDVPAGCLSHHSSCSCCPQDVYDHVAKPVLFECLKGYSGAILACALARLPETFLPRSSRRERFAGAHVASLPPRFRRCSYGQTGSGKTHSLMNGGESGAGLTRARLLTLSPSLCYVTQLSLTRYRRPVRGWAFSAASRGPLYGDIRGLPQRVQRRSVLLPGARLWNPSRPHLNCPLSGRACACPCRPDGAAGAVFSAAQIYNEQVDDLLKGTQGLRLRQAEDGDWVVEGLSWFQCGTPQFLLQCFQNGRKRLSYAETNMNKHSSR